MPQVPYSPVPSVAPSQQATPGVSLDVGAQTFGGEIARSIKGLGGQMEHVGDEIFKRAVALQEMENDAQAKDASIELAKRDSQLFFDFKSLQGKDAPAALPKYRTDLEVNRAELRNKLPNDAARRIFDRDSKSSFIRSFFSGAEHAATQNKKWQGESAESSILVEMDRVARDPSDAQYQDSVRNIHTQTKGTLAGVKGWDPTTADVKTRQMVSALTRSRIEGLADKEPFKAEEMRNELKDNLFGDDIEKTKDAVKARMDNVGSRQISQRINAIPNQTEADVKERAKEEAEKVARGDVVFEQNVVERAISDHRRNQSVKKETERQHLETIAAGIEAGAKDIDQLYAMEGMPEAIKGIPVSKRNQIQGQINRYQAAINKPIREDNMEWAIGKRMWDREYFLDIDPTTLELSANQMNQIWAWQKADSKVAHEVPIVKKAIGWLRDARGSQMQALDVYSRKENNKDVFDRFSGAMYSAIEIWKKDHGANPEAKDIIDNIGPTLLRQQTSKFLGFISYTSEQAVFNKLPTDQFRADYIKREMATGRPDEPSEEEQVREYHKFLLYQIQEQRAKGVQPSAMPKPTGKPSVPSSGSMTGAP